MFSRSSSILALLIVTRLSYAFEPVENLQIHGFLSQGYSWTSQNEFFGVSSNSGSIDYTQAAINFSWTPWTWLRVSSQGLYRRAGQTNRNQLSLDYGFLDFTLWNVDHGQLSIKGGRVKSAIGFYNETRDVPFTNPSILLPQGLYLDAIRSIFLSFNGVSLSSQLYTDWGNFFLTSQAGYLNVNSREFGAFLIRDFSDIHGDFTGEFSTINRLLWEYDGGRIRAAVSYLNLNYRYDEANLRIHLEDTPSGTYRSKPWYFSLQYNAPRWSLTGEYRYGTNIRKGFGTQNVTGSNSGGYIQGIYHINENWDLLARYEKFEQYVTSTNLSSPSLYDEDYVVGLTWRPTQSWQLRLENHYIHGDYWLPVLDNRNQSKVKKDWDLLMFEAAYRF